MRAISYENPKFNIKEPFNGLFTQGMVCHETYKDEKNNWISPDEIETINGKKYLKNNKSTLITVGPSESMSKSKKNTIDPENIISNYGADAARLFILSDSPPEKDVQWSEEGINSSYKFIQKLWNLNTKIKDEINKNHTSDNDDKLVKNINKFIKKITDNLNNFSYNKIIANMHEMNTFLTKQINLNYKPETLRQSYEKFLISIMPIIPHFSSECLEMLNSKINRWPEYDKLKLEEETVNIVVQINGKKRGLIKDKNNISEEELIETISKDELLSRYVQNKKIKRRIFIKNKLINIII